MKFSFATTQTVLNKRLTNFLFFYYCHTFILRQVDVHILNLKMRVLSFKWKFKTFVNRSEVDALQGTYYKMKIHIQNPKESSLYKHHMVSGGYFISCISKANYLFPFIIHASSVICHTAYNTRKIAKIKS